LLLEGLLVTTNPLAEVFGYPQVDGIPLVRDERLPGIVNVASVPQRSPFRSPGGKTWLVPTARRWLRHRSHRPAVLIEPFAGGASIGLTAGFERLTDQVHLVELDADVASVWQTVLSPDCAWLAQKITDFPLTPVAVKDTLDAPATSIRDRAFVTILKNQVYHGGILALGSGLLKYGENGKGLTSRWYPETLARQIMDIWEIRDRFQFTQGDGIAALVAVADREDVVAFNDPPYSSSRKRAGSRLYTHFTLDHEALLLPRQRCEATS
jgi:DNA adenine methylase